MHWPFFDIGILKASLKLPLLWFFQPLMLQIYPTSKAWLEAGIRQIICQPHSSLMGCLTEPD